MLRPVMPDGMLQAQSRHPLPGSAGPAAADVVPLPLPPSGAVGGGGGGGGGGRGGGSGRSGACRNGCTSGTGARTSTLAAADPAPARLSAIGPVAQWPPTSAGWPSGLSSWGGTPAPAPARVACWYGRGAGRSPAAYACACAALKGIPPHRCAIPSALPPRSGLSAAAPPALPHSGASLLLPPPGLRQW